MTDAQSFIVVTTLATLISSVTAIVTILVNRKLAIIERKAATAEIIERARAEAEALEITSQANARVISLELQTVAERIRLETLRAAAQLREEQRVNSELLTDQIADVKTVSTDALSVANHVNEKIANLNKRLLHEEQTDKLVISQATDQKIDTLQGTADAIETKVDGLAQQPLKP